MKLTAIFEQVGEWWLGYVEEVPGANVQEQTLDEARESLREAVQLIIEANRLKFHCPLTSTQAGSLSR